MNGEMRVIAHGDGWAIEKVTAGGHSAGIVEDGFTSRRRAERQAVTLADIYDCEFKRELPDRPAEVVSLAAERNRRKPWLRFTEQF